MDFCQFDSSCRNNWRRYRQTLRESSKTNDGDYCLESGYAADIEILRIENLIHDWMDVKGRKSDKKACPSTVDALYVSGKRWWYIEFKRNEKKTLNEGKAKLMYKIYDTVLQLVEHNLRSVREVRDADCYVVVARRVFGRTDEEFRRLVSIGGPEAKELFEAAVNGIDDSVLLRPWKTSPPQVDANLDHWNGVLYRQALTLTPDQFNLYAKEQGWK